MQSDGLVFWAIELIMSRIGPQKVLHFKVKIISAAFETTAYCNKPKATGRAGLQHSLLEHADCSRLQLGLLTGTLDS